MSKVERDLSLPQDELALGYEIQQRFMGIQDRTAEFPDPEMGQEVSRYLSEQSPLVDFFLAVPESSYDVRVNEHTPQGPSASTRTNLAHLVQSLRGRTNGLWTGEIRWEPKDQREEQLPKRVLMEMLMDVTEEFVEVAAGTKVHKMIKIPKGKEFDAVTAVQFIRDMAGHAVLHQGIAIAGVGDLIGMPRSAAFTRRWGP